MKKILLLALIIATGSVECHSTNQINNPYTSSINTIGMKQVQTKQGSSNTSQSSRAEINQMSAIAQNMKLVIDSIEHYINKIFTGKSISEFYKKNSEPFIKNLRQYHTNFINLLKKKNIKNDLYKYQLIFTGMENECNNYVKQCKARYLDNQSNIFKTTHYFAYNKKMLTELCNAIEKSYIPTLKQQFGNFMRNNYGYSFAGF